MMNPATAIAAVLALGGLVHVVLFAISGLLFCLVIAVMYLVAGALGALVAVRAR